MFKALFQSRWLHPLLLLAWIAIGAGLRFAQLTSKPLWNDEFATLVFSLGNSFRTIQLDQPLSLDTLLMPLQPNPAASIQTVIHNLLSESTHPPVYFVLTHLWLQLFPPENELVSIWGARVLPALLGVAAIPAMFALGWFAFRSQRVGQLTAAMMAVSPYGIYLAQEIRHYTLAILLIIASLGCLVTAGRTLYRQVPLPLWISLIWVGVNCLGIAVHYFFALTLCAEGLVVLGFWIRDFRQSTQETASHLSIFSQPWLRIYAVAAGTLIGGLVWLPILQGVPDHQLTQWIYEGNPLSNWLGSIGRLLGWIITMLTMLPVEGTPQPITIAAGAAVVIFVFWMLPLFVSGWRIQLRQPSTRRETQVLGGFLLAAIALFFGMTFGVGADLTIAARYHFVYFPAVIVLFGATLAVSWQDSNLSAEGNLVTTQPQQSPLILKARGKKAVALIVLMGFLGGVTVVCNFGYQKSERADLLVPIIHKVSQVPVLIATSHETHEQTREMMGLALEFKRFYHSLNSAETASPLNPPQFLLAHQEPGSSNAVEVLQKVVYQLERPFDLWVVNFLPDPDPEINSCSLDTGSRPKMNGYKHRLYHCQ